MNTSSTPSQNPQKTQGRSLKLPFDKRKKGDFSTWIYRHRVGLLVTVIIYISAAILFISYKIVIQPSSQGMIEVEFEQPPMAVQEPEPTPEEKKEIEQIEQQADQKMRNRISDANSKLDASLRDSKRLNADKIYDEAERVQAQMAAGQEAYAKSLRDIEQSSSRSKSTQSTSSGSDEKRQAANYKGSVSVVYDLINRTDNYLHIPAYQCQNAGVVVVMIVVNRNGRVISANVDKSTSPDDPCLTEMSVKAAMASSFNASTSASDRQRGTITYTFKAQDRVQ